MRMATPPASAHTFYTNSTFPSNSQHQNTSSVSVKTQSITMADTLSATTNNPIADNLQRVNLSSQQAPRGPDLNAAPYINPNGRANGSIRAGRTQTRSNHSATSSRRIGAYRRSNFNRTYALPTGPQMRYDAMHGLYHDPPPLPGVNMCPPREFSPAAATLEQFYYPYGCYHIGCYPNCQQCCQLHWDANLGRWDRLLGEHEWDEAAVRDSRVYWGDRNEYRFPCSFTYTSWKTGEKVSRWVESADHMPDDFERALPEEPIGDEEKIEGW
ncbi:hypothetical protein BT63DRAFT_282252 [Microthyrium microscopicum]|uniref:Uncharacterized protein n=1 Tax=Microthyrium microscopicum TaxID=703497 RepID=A0A6A6UAM9_9PEZI|nr:hypothetical protein BT63DRAFT_282252 [Microthyrium microscopicum]